MSRNAAVRGTRAADRSPGVGDPGTVVISSGFQKTHVTTAAREASDRGLLAQAIVSIYPTARLVRLLRILRLADKGRIARLLERGEGIPEARLRPLFWPEVLCELARAVRPIPGIKWLYDPLVAATFRLYGRRASAALGASKPAHIYHFRAGFGGASVERARELGMVTLCDHSIAHPSLLEELVEKRGRMPDLSTTGDAASRAPRHPVERTILADIERAEAILVNSDFVRETLVVAGVPAERVHVIYLGVDDNFLAGGPARRMASDDATLRLLYAGRLERRKGADVLIEALRELDGQIAWELVVAGPIAPDIHSQHARFLADRRVKLLGTLRRPELMAKMLEIPVFVFPSYAEGSARAVFEALACGCFVITTPNAGSIVEDGVHGALVPPGDVDGLVAAILAADRNRQRVLEIGRRNATVVATRFRQTDYGDGLAALYRKLADTPPA